MKRKHPIILLFPFLVLLCSCTYQAGSTRITEAGLYSDTCANDPENSYELYLPQLSVKSSELPLVVVLDPHGQGKAALEHFRQAADKYQLLVVASNQVRNHYPNYLQSVDDLVNDVKAKYPASDELYLAGFSGGARMALSYAARNPVQGVLVSGALAEGHQLQQIQSPVMVLSGMADFNFIEAAQYIFRPSAAPENLYIEFTASHHNWPPGEQISNALAYILFTNTTRSSKTNNNREILAAFSIEQYQHITQLTSDKNYLQAGLIARNMSRSTIFNEFEEFGELRNSIETGAPFQSDLQRLKESILMELTVRKEYAHAIQSKNLGWWQPEIEVLDQRIAENQDRYQQWALLRIKAFLGILCYTLSNQSLQMEDFTALERLLPVYEYLEPDNADMHFFRAKLALHRGKQAKGIEALQQSLADGFTDMERIQAEFPESWLKGL